jgi:hypothetical protein
MFDFEDVSDLFLFGLENIGEDNVYGQLLAKMDGLVKHCVSSFGVLKSKLNSFFSHASVVAQPLDDIQKIFSEMKETLMSIKAQLQSQIGSGSVDLCAAWELSLSFVDLYSQKSTSIHDLVNDHISKPIDFHLGMLHFHSEFSFLKIRLIGIKKMVRHNSLSGVVQSLCQLVPLIDIYFSKCGLNLNWTDEAITQFKTGIREMFSSELCSLIKKDFSLPILNDETFDLALTIEECMDKLSNTEIDNSSRHTIGSYMTSKFTTSDFAKTKQRNPSHPIFSSRFFLTSWF